MSMVFQGRYADPDRVAAARHRVLTAEQNAKRAWENLKTDETILACSVPSLGLLMDLAMLLVSHVMVQDAERRLLRARLCCIRAEANEWRFSGYEEGPESIRLGG